MAITIFMQMGKAQTTEVTVEADHLKDDSSEELLMVNASEYGMKYRETTVLMQNRMGLRIEYTLDRSSLSLWIRPGAGESMSYVDHNWSNRDDHTEVFDRILLPGCDLSNFEKCDWDPFHSVLYFKNQTLHIAQIYDQPAVVLWFEKDGKVDFKKYGNEPERTENSFILNFTDRERDFQSAVVLGQGDGYIQHQTQVDKYRSLHARANMKAGQVLIIASDAAENQIGKQAKEWVKKPVEEIIRRNEELIAKDLHSGRFSLKGKPEMQALLDKSRRVALSMQDFKGFMRSTNQYIYYLMWFRDAGMNVSHLTYSGWPEVAYHSTKFALSNPNFTNDNPDEKFFGQMMGGPLTKWQEDGLFYVLWPAFSYWTQTGDKSLCEGEYLANLESGMNWLERRTFNEELGLFGRYFYCETPMTGSRDDGFDNVTGAPTDKWASLYKGDTIVCSYDNYVNFLHYSSYLMMSAMQTDESKADMYYQKAVNLEKNMKKFMEYDNALPSYGLLETIDGRLIEAAPYGLDIWDYVWGLSLPPFEINAPAKYKALREQLRKDMTTTESGYFLCVYFAALTGMDTQIHDEDDIMAAMDQLVPMSRAPGKYLPMPDAMPEMFNMDEENPFHDVRPLVYSIAPWISAVTNLSLSRLSFGIAARPTKYIESLDAYEYKGAMIDVVYEGDGQEIGALILNGKPLIGTWQIPDLALTKGENTLTVKLSDTAVSDVLIASTVQLNDVLNEEGESTFDVEAWGKNVLTFKNLTKKVTVLDAEGKKVKLEKKVMDDLTYLEFTGRGAYVIKL